MFLDFSLIIRQMDRPPAPSALVWPSQHDTCSLVLFWLGFRVYTFLFGSLRILALSGRAPRVFVGRLLLVYRWCIPFPEVLRCCELRHRVVYVAMRHLTLVITRCGGIYSLIFVCFE